MLNATDMLHESPKLLSEYQKYIVFVLDELVKIRHTDTQIHMRGSNADNLEAIQLIACSIGPKGAGDVPETTDRAKTHAHVIVLQLINEHRHREQRIRASA